MPLLTAPYNFVPLTPHVVRPAWAVQISHDKPFSDPKSGTLKLTITAITPIFTRNSISRRILDSLILTAQTEAKQRNQRITERELDEVKQRIKNEAGSHFSKMDGQCFLPGSSIKGPIRNVLEIMSFGDLAVGREEERYAMRDLQHDGYKAMFAENSSQKVQCGWLYQSNGKERIIDCGEPLKVPQSWIDGNFGTNHFRQFAEGTMQMSDGYKAAQKKYGLFRGKSLDVNFMGRVGTLVFTGQPTANTQSQAKRNEFLFPASNEVIELEEQVFKDFQIAYFENDKPSQKPDYKHWMSKLRAGGRVPVFFHKDKKGKVASMGLAFMYKVPFTFSVLNAVNHHQKNSGTGPDLAQCIFGYVESKALKGRVVFGHAYAEQNPSPIALKNEVLNSPKPTYYPTYIKQEVNNSGKVPFVQGKYRYKTLFDRDATPSGWKRYPVHNPDSANNGIETTIGNDSLKTAFRPLPAGTAFTCQVQYHNLRTVELGALLSALRFHETEGCFHTLGMAKPLGYGQCSITVEGISEDDKIAALKAYEAYMESQLQGINGGWAGSDAITELLTMSAHQNNTEERSRLKYMDAVRDFAIAKREGQALARYTKLPGIALGIKTVTRLCSEAELNEARLSSIATPVAGSESLQDVFNQQKLRLQNELTNLMKQKKEEADKLLEEQQAEAERQKKIAEAEDSEKALKAKELAAGINLNGVSAIKTVDALLRACKYWKEKVGGSFAEAEVNKIKERLSHVDASIKPKDKQAWALILTKNLLSMNVYLTPEQIKEIETHVKTLT